VSRPSETRRSRSARSVIPSAADCSSRPVLTAGSRRYEVARDRLTTTLYRRRGTGTKRRRLRQGGRRCVGRAREATPDSQASTDDDVGVHADDMTPWRGCDVRSPTEASGRLVAPAVFKTDVVEYLDQAGSIPVRLRQPANLSYPYGKLPARTKPDDSARLFPARITGTPEPFAIAVRPTWVSDPAQASHQRAHRHVPILPVDSVSLPGKRKPGKRSRSRMRRVCHRQCSLPRVLPPGSEIGGSEPGGLTPPFRRVGWIPRTSWWREER